jgi:hypothetical protein
LQDRALKRLEEGNDVKIDEEYRDLNKRAV